MYITFEPLDLQKPGKENLAENFTTSEDLIHFLKINQNSYKLLPIDTEANTNASAIQKLQEIFWELLPKTIWKICL